MAFSVSGYVEQKLKFDVKLDHDEIHKALSDLKRTLTQFIYFSSYQDLCCVGLKKRRLEEQRQAVVSEITRFNQVWTKLLVLLPFESCFVKRNIPLHALLELGQVELRAALRKNPYLLVHTSLREHFKKEDDFKGLIRELAGCISLPREQREAMEKYASIYLLLVDNYGAASQIQIQQKIDEDLDLAAITELDVSLGEHKESIYYSDDMSTIDYFVESYSDVCLRLQHISAQLKYADWQEFLRLLNAIMQAEDDSSSLRLRSSVCEDEKLFAFFKSHSE